MTTIEGLRKAKEKISDPKNWSRNYLAVDAEGKDCPVRSTQAVAWCIIGAVQFVAYRSQEDGHEFSGAVVALRDTLFGKKGIYATNSHSLAEFNNAETTKHKDIMKLFDRTIKRLSK